MSTQIQYTRQELINKFYPIYFYRKRFDIACRDLLGLKLAPHHSITLRDWGTRKFYNVMLSGRGMGKSVLIAIYYVLQSLLYPLNKNLIAAGIGYRGSKAVMLEMEKIINCELQGQEKVGYAKASLADPRKVINKDPSYWSIKFSNGSITYAVPLGTGQTIRGLRSQAIAQDEAFLLPSALVQAVLEPFLNVLHDPTKSREEQDITSQSIKTSTIDFSHREFYKEYLRLKTILEEGKKIEIGESKITDDDVSCFEWNFEDAFYKTATGKIKTVWGIDFQRLIERKDNPSVDLDIWNAENKNIPMDTSGGYFPIDAVESCSNVDLSGKDLDLYPQVIDTCSAQCILGVDMAPASANTAFVVLKIGNFNSVERDITLCETANAGSPCPLLGMRGICKYKKHLSVVYAHEENKMPMADRGRLIYELMERFNIVAIGMDARGGGFEMSSLLKDPDFVRHVVGTHLPPIFDPERDRVNGGLPILTLYTTNQDDNLSFNGYLKGLITNTQLLIPKQLRGRPDNERVFRAYGHIESLISQLIRIKAMPAGKSLKFEIETTDPETGKKVSGNKDLYSALLYAAAKLQQMIEVKNSTEHKNYTFAEPVLFNM